MAGEETSLDPMEAHYLSSGRAFRLADPEDDNDLPVLSDPVENEAISGIDLEAIGAPAKPLGWRGIAPADQIHPEGLVDLRAHLVGGKRKPLPLRGFVHPPEGGVDVVNDLGGFHQGVGRDDIERLRALLARQFREGIPDQLQSCCRVLPAAITDHPWALVSKIDGPDFLVPGLEAFQVKRFRGGKLCASPLAS